MDIDRIQAAKAEIAATSAYQTVTGFFDDGSFCEIDAFAKSGEGFAEVVAGFGTSLKSSISWLLKPARPLSAFTTAWAADLIRAPSC